MNAVYESGSSSPHARSDLLPVYWLPVWSRELPGGTEWLSPAEQAVFGQLRFPKRKQEWLLGRWTAKRLILTHRQAAGAIPADVRPRDVSIIAAADGAPDAYLGDALLPCTLSITHRSGLAVAMIADRAAPLGCDLELIEPRSAVFVNDYFTAEEQVWLASPSQSERAFRTALLWSAKESALKAARTGLRRDTRSLQVVVREEPARDPGVTGDWEPLAVRDLVEEPHYHGFWRLVSPELVLTMVGRTAPALSAPVV